ncbi:hypothetical protein GMDG_06613 [Pseudogymnoascus destructans 20631-21]|uniref:Polar growth protein n=1 Tax=Pseudogymnoascus destructans (strain ATCC MYA-4855 / 20631-21) TaxID=658429 RepID=L8FWV6_PSED2|nr:hypothetical protein GMDG_06613 [Pseudogymnoascus destructans 20631-21]
MASPLPDKTKPRPEKGQILLVIHDFIARGSDELTLTRGDRVELVERDDDFGDGWYLGKHLTDGATGLFPEVYTKTAPQGPPVVTQMPPVAAATPRPVPAPEQTTPTAETPAPAPLEAAPPPVALDTRNSVPVEEATKTTQVERHISASQVLDAGPPSPSPLNTPQSASQTYASEETLPTVVEPISVVPKSVVSSGVALGLGQESPVMNETLSVIQEHISNMSTPRNSGGGIAERRGTNDSGSEYSSHIDRRASYINGSETDEEEAREFNRAEVSKWTAAQVAEHLGAAGVEQAHCDVFRNQEISGDVLLGMDQSTIFLKEFELGPVGRRLKTWQKIKALQDEVHGVMTPSGSRRVPSIYGSEMGSDVGGTRSQYYSASTRYSSQRQTGRLSLMGQSSVFPEEQQRPGMGQSRPSAASIREFNHSRRHSSIDSPTLLNQAKSPDGPQATTPTMASSGHKKLPSFDRNWTMGDETPSAGMRPASQAGVHPAASDEAFPAITSTTPYDLDRGYFSGTEAEGRTKNVLRKRTGSHSRQSSYTDEQRLRSATTVNRHSRFGSIDSLQQPHLSPAGQKYYGVAGARRTPSVGSIRPAPPPKDTPSPMVTKLDGIPLAGPSKTQFGGRATDWFNAAAARGGGFRAISDAVTGKERARNGVDQQLVSPTDSNRSPSRTGSSTPSGGPSFDLESSNTSKSTILSAAARSNRKKGKKETSAYTRGLQHISPKEAMENCDYSGWMKKKSMNIMTTWKPRLFILKGRRLSYYYSENDTEEKGLIDISFHRVLPADNDRLTGLHATITSAISGPNSPQGAQTPTTADTDAAAEAEKGLKTEADSMFIFKLMPPRTGLSRAVTFTKPTVHYFAVPNIAQGRLWMAALMKATIDRDDTTPVTTTYQQKTISLAKARAMRHRPPALMNLEEGEERVAGESGGGLDIRGVEFGGGGGGGGMEGDGE